jgi:hypothetical protein
LASVGGSGPVNLVLLGRIAMAHADLQREMELVSLLRNEASSLARVAPRVAGVLNGYAERISDQSTIEPALLELDRYAQHYKGLIDVVVPGVTDHDWRSFVHSVRELTRHAVRQRRLDSSIIGKLHTFVSKMRHAP